MIDYLEDAITGLAIEKREISSEWEKVGAEIGCVGDAGDGEEAGTV